MKHELHLAEELAEQEYLTSSVAELLELARQSIRSSWLDRAYRSTEDIRKAHKDMQGETDREV